MQQISQFFNSRLPIDMLGDMRGFYESVMSIQFIMKFNSLKTVFETCLVCNFK